MKEALANHLSQAQAFEVPIHTRMLIRVPGKRPNTVLAIEQLIYTWRISEYTDPYSYGRHWCYSDPGVALDQLFEYLTYPAQPEPGGWLRAVDFGDDLDAPHDHTRMRRARVEFGERVIVIDDGENDPWA